MPITPMDTPQLSAKDPVTTRRRLLSHDQKSTLPTGGATEATTPTVPAPSPNAKSTAPRGITLTPEQQRAADYGLGTRAVLATAGAGKTTTLATRIASLMLSFGVPDREILATTFTKAAAADLKARIDKFTGRKTSIQAGTLHSFCVQLLYRHWGLLGYKSPRFTILSEGDMDSELEKLTLQVTGKKSRSEITTFTFDDVKKWLGELDVREFSSDKRDHSAVLAASNPPGAVLEICRLYKERARTFGYVDFDSILTETLRLLKKAPPTLLEQLPKYVFVDEAQDLSGIQWFVVEELGRHAKSLDVIGDDDQSIYYWRSALPWRFRAFSEKATQKHFMSANRRCASDIVKLASQVVSQIPPTRRIAKDLSAARTEPGEIRFTVLGNLNHIELLVLKIKQLTEQKGNTYDDYAMIVRSTTDTFPAAEGALKKLGVPYRVLGGKSTFQKPESRLFRAICNIVLHGWEAEPMAHWSTLMNELGVSGDAADAILREASGTDGTLNALTWAAKGSRIAEASKGRLASLFTMVGQLRGLATIKLRDVVTHPFVKQVLRDTIEKRATAEVRSRARKETAAVAPAMAQEASDLTDKRFGGLMGFLSGFMDTPLGSAMLALDVSEKDTEEDDFPKVTLTTAHSAKGLEWDTVFVLEANGATWPSRMGLKGLADAPVEVHMDVNDEERRLLYVAITRAKNLLYLVTTVVHPHRNTRQEPSEFLPKWVTQQTRETFEKSAETGLTHGVTLALPEPVKPATQAAQGGATQAQLAALKAHLGKKP